MIDRKPLVLGNKTIKTSPTTSEPVETAPVPHGGDVLQRQGVVVILSFQHRYDRVHRHGSSA